MSTQYQPQSVYEPNYLASLIEKDEELVDPGHLLLPTPPHIEPPAYPTALVPPTGTPYQPWDDPRYALSSMQSYPSQMYTYPQQQQQLYRNGTSHAMSNTSPVEAPTLTSSIPQLQHANHSMYSQPSPMTMHYQNVYQQQQQQAPVVPVYRPSNFMTVPLRRQPSEAVEYDRASNSTPPTKRGTVSGTSSSASSVNGATPAGGAKAPPKPRVGLYEATYSNVSVFELSVNGVGVMRRQSDSWINATHVLKVAGIEKGRRTKILEREIHHGEHEKIQGGYGKYQGTWIPLERAKQLAREYGVFDGLQPLLEI
ncbi:transcriptional regulator swi6 [Rhizophlyctis rosea]|uniref:Transcriptional regulator swi6 n=1 Tax=Rhizophlyctis rosea TaxID=64517 RepID=A0AAD5SBH7_9FUNG|nr:transcriptional regulator swi6 [Rhizophlyctis rosea]